MPDRRSEQPWKPTRAQLAAAVRNRVRDVLVPGLDVLFVGINPGLYSAAVRHHFGHPGNRFWPSLRAGGFTRGEPLGPFDEGRLPEFGLGITNLCPRATARADELSAEELRRGAATLRRKLRRFRPRFVAFLGITSYRTAFGVKAGTIGRQPDSLCEAVAWVLPNPSGLNAHFLPADLARLFGELKAAVEESRER